MQLLSAESITKCSNADCLSSLHFSVAEKKNKSYSPCDNELAGHYTSSIEHASHLPAFTTSILSMHKVSYCALKLWSDNRHAASHLNMYSIAGLLL